jgi:hypothetical protein
MRTATFTLLSKSLTENVNSLKINVIFSCPRANNL